MSYSNRIFLYGPVVAVMLLAMGYVGYWFVVSGRIDGALERANGNEIIPGITFQFADKEFSGFPFRFDVLLTGVTLSARSDAGESAWRSERIALHAMSYGGGLYLLEADGLQTFSWPARDGGPQNIVQLTPGVARASVIFRDGKLARFDLDMINTKGHDASLEAAANRDFSVVRAQAHLLAQGGDTMELFLSADAANIGLGFRPAFGPDLSRLRVNGEITEAEFLDALRAGTANPDDAFRNWREEGGMLVLDPIEVAWGGAQLMGTSDLTLDGEDRLTGLVSLSPEDPVSFLGALSQSEMLPQDARAQLGALREMAAGLGGNLDIPITLQAHLPLDGPVTPRLGFGISGSDGDLNYPASGIVIDFQGAETP